MSATISVVNIKQVAQLSQRDRAAKWLSFDKKSGRRCSADNI